MYKFHICYFVNISATSMSSKQMYSKPKLPPRFLFTVSRQRCVIHTFIPREYAILGIFGTIFP